VERAGDGDDGQLPSVTGWRATRLICHWDCAAADRRRWRFPQNHVIGKRERHWASGAALDQSLSQRRNHLMAWPSCACSIPNAAHSRQAGAVENFFHFGRLTR
jgi:hypothetical protein